MMFLITTRSIFSTFSVYFREGNISDLKRAGSLQQYLNELHEEYGDVISFWHGTTSIVSVANVHNFAPRNQIFDIPSMTTFYFSIMQNITACIHCM